LLQKGKDIIRQHKDNLRYKIKYAHEIALAIVIHIGHHLTPAGWNIDDYIAAWKTEEQPIHKPAIVNALRVIKGIEYNRFMLDHSRKQLDYVLDTTFNNLASALLNQESPPPEFNKEKLRNDAYKLLEMGNSYGINAGKKIRSLMLAVVCLAAVCLREKIPVKTSRKMPINFKSKNKKPSTKKRNTNATKKRERKISLRPAFVWDFSQFAPLVHSRVAYIRKIYIEYYDLLTRCAAKVPWIEQPVPSNAVVHHLDDILNLFGGTNPQMKVELKPPTSFARNRALEQQLQTDIKAARAFIARYDGPPEKPTDDDSSLLYHVYCLLVHGYTEEEILAMNTNRIRNAVEAISFKYQYGFRKEEIKNQNLDRKKVEEDDMSKREVSVYLEDDVEEHVVVLQEENDDDDLIW
jgi:hypothetical protein